MTKPKAQQEASKRGRGRPPSYSATHVKAVRAMAARGWMDVEMARAIGVNPSTFRRWKAEHPEFLSAATPTPEEQLAAVKGALLHRALGYSHMAEKIMTRSIGDGCSEIVREEYVEHYPPDVAAIRYFLNNKSGGEYKDTQEVEQRGDVVVRVEGGLPEKEDGTK